MEQRAIAVSDGAEITSAEARGGLRGTTIGALASLARPKILLYLMLLVVAGFRWAHWDRAIANSQFVGKLAAACVAWTLLHAGTMWLNAAVDRDVGEVLYGRAVAVPSGTATIGYLALAACLIPAWFAAPLVGSAAALCVVLSVLYSHPRTMWKGHPVGGPLVNVVGYGLLTPLAGWAVTDARLNPRTMAVWGATAFGVSSCYFAAQAFQEAEDRRRGYRTLVVTHGPRAAIRAAAVCCAGMVSIGFGLVIAGWLPRTLLVMAVLLPSMGRWLSRWMGERDGGGERYARGFVARLLTAGIACIAIMFATYWYQRLTGAPVAGLGTAAGHPPM